MFDQIASSYDRTNAVISLNLHKLWNRSLINEVSKCQPQSYLDLCAGTGEIGLGFLKKAKTACHLSLLDFSEQMLECAKNKAAKIQFNQQHHINYLHADAQKIPLDNASIDVVTVAYGIRNVANPQQCFSEVLRVLKPGGTFSILELTTPSNPILRLGHKGYLKTVVPFMGWCFSSNQEAYKYLCNSIQTFTKPKELEHLLLETGFQSVTIHPVSCGIATIILAKKQS